MNTPSTAAPSGVQKLSELPLDELQKRLECDTEGLATADAKKRLERFGFNELSKEPVHPLIKFLSYFWGPIPWMIEAAAVLSALVQHWADFAIIMTLLVVNAVVGFWEEFQAGNAIAALKEKLALEARVKRGGQWQSVPARELVPGDLIRIRLGDIVPADARLLDGDSVEVDQSALTGESLPVTRNAGDAVYSGSILKQGEIDALVYGTGSQTYFGRTAHLVETAHTASHFQRAVLKIGNFLIIVAVSLVVLILLVALFRGDPIAETLQFALVLTVAAIPVAMPTVLSVTMAVGARVLARGQAIVSRLASIEELAGMDILCSDKTGTLTQNKLTLGEPFLADGVTIHQILQAARLASRAENQDSIDQAVLNAKFDEGPEDGFQVTHFQPFDPVHKRTEATVRGRDGGEFKTSKGAPQVILELVDDVNAIRPQVDDAIDRFAARGFRSLGVAQTDETGKWRFLGVLPLYDPPREDSKVTIATARQMGCQVKMVTGDQLAIGREIAAQLDMGRQFVDAKVFQETTYHQAARVDHLIENADGFAQVYPEHKFHIVDVLQKHGHIVGMTGDGVNDAPALKKADCGIAVSGATDAARAAADIVLLSPGLSVVIDAIKEARKIFQRMNSYAIYRIAETIRVLLFMTLSILIFNFYPVTAVMIVLLALLNDGAILSIAYDKVRYANQPERWNMRLVLGIASVLGLAGVAASFLLFYLAERVYHLDRDTIQSLVYLKLSVAGHMTVFVTRTRGPFWSIAPAKMLLGAVLGTQLVATLIAVYGIFMAPIGWELAGLVWVYALAWFLVNDRLKLFAYEIFDHQPPRSATAESDERTR
ncbi:plasma-membrane proton-efflux P-type ATPase [Roseiconus nitratireducens]|uniref:Plasma-membrane proton-efflux P-type ATPase n=1 Tax=Roseiconus nitratireducens TaxID=2605748 RepID=A0A5M6CW84_9BACT|nr:plasma-membrane proton-efflux P-type ATPase [Roseiconus nitratireducens]KAA5539481.1 plasma-membrane proton-efflux P-type ATPase [Roseiconus nitratireducens]